MGNFAGLKFMFDFCVSYFYDVREIKCSSRRTGMMKLSEEGFKLT